MNRATLVQNLQEMGIPLRVEWTVPELRATLIEELEARGVKGIQPLGLTRLNIDELKERCQAEGLMFPARATKGTLMKMLRDNAPPSDYEIVPFGRYKNYHYHEVHESYLQWAIKEVKTKDNPSPDLARLARWAEARNTTPLPTMRHVDPEAASTQPPKTPMPKPKGYPKPTPKKSSRTSRTRPLSSEDDWSEVTEAEGTVDEQIKVMESRLAVLKAVKEQEDKAQLH